MAAVFEVSLEQHPRKKGARLIQIGRFALAAALLAILFVRFINPKDLASAFRQLRPGFILLTFVSYLLWRAFSTWQLSYIMKCRDLALPFWRIFRVHTIAILFSTALPSDFAGAAATWYMLSRDTGKRAIVANSLIYLRILTLIVLAAFAYAGLMLEPVGTSFKEAHLLAGISGAIFVCLCLVLTRAGTHFVEFCLNAVLSVLSKFSQRVRLAIAASGFFTEARALQRLPLRNHIGIWTWSLAVNLAAALITFFAMRAAAIALPFAVSMWLIGVIAVIQIVALTPGGLGLREFSIVALLKSAYDIAPEKALAFAALILALNLIFGAGLGGYWMLFPPSDRS
jgi:uncharacterized protein (TIRG00374 family)